MTRKRQGGHRAPQRRHRSPQPGAQKAKAGASARSEAGRSLSRGAVILALAIAAMVVALVVSLILNLHTSRATGAKPTATSMATVIDGIPCDVSPAYYHEHAHLTILNRGKAVTVPANIGINDDTCLYWLHTHDSSGEIHMEAPHRIAFSLGAFFDIWGQPLSSTHVASAVLGHGQSVRTYVNGRLYRGSLRSISLRRHTQVTIEVGKPFKPPVPFDFQGD